jgi:CTP:molybdopterin cytidylyltransferase MocA
VLPTGACRHPAVLERSTFSAVLALDGDEGARGLLAGPGTRHVACDGLGRPDDIDTCEELEATEAAAASRLMRTK